MKNNIPKKDNFLIHSLTANTSGNNTPASIMNIISQKPNSSSTQSSNQKQKEGE